MTQKPSGDRTRKRQRRADNPRPRVSVTLSEPTLKRIDSIAGKMSYSAFVAEATDFLITEVEEGRVSFGSPNTKGKTSRED